VVDQVAQRATDVIEARRKRRVPPKETQDVPERVQQVVDNQDLIAQQFPKETPAIRGRAAIQSKIVPMKEQIANRLARRAARRVIGNLRKEDFSDYSSTEWDTEDEKELHQFATQASQTADI
jgi:hypothetical protein